MALTFGQLLLHRVQKKKANIILPRLCQMLIDFQNSFTARLVGKFAIKLSLSIPPHLTNVATLLCEILMSKTNDNIKHV